MAKNGVKDKVRILLEESRNIPISGEKIAEELNCTRAGVWKAIKALREEGYLVEAVNNRGYTLRTSADTLSQAYIAGMVRNAGIDIEIETLKTVDSTNSLLKRYAADGKTKDMVVISEEQTAGRGRRGRSFYSPAGTGLYISFLLHPDFPASEAASLTTVAAVAEGCAIESVTGMETSIKWVNDLWMRGKKVSGILTEAATSLEDGTLDYCVVGIGINLYEPEGGFPEEIREIAGSVYPEDKKQENLKNKIAAALIIRFLEYYRAFPDRKYLEDYRKRCFCIGKTVNIMTVDHTGISKPAEDASCSGAANSRNTAFVLGINDECHLHVRYPDGEEAYLSSGEISIRL